MSARSSPPFHGPPEEFDVVVKVKFGETLKRFNGYVNGPSFNLNLCALRSKIASAFKFAPDVEFVLTYTDEDGDVVMLDEDDDLHDAVIYQKLNPLRINVQLKNIQDGASQNEQKQTNSMPRSTTHEDLRCHIKSVIDDAMKSIPEPVPDALAKLSHEVLDAAPPQLAELIKPFVKLITPSSSNNKPSDKYADNSSSSSSGVPQTQVDLKSNDQTKATESLGQRPLNAQYSEYSEPRGLKSVLVENPVAPNAEASQDQQASLYPSLDELLFSCNSFPGKSTGKGKSVVPSASPPAPPVVPVFCPTPPTPSINGWSHPKRCEPKDYSMWQSEANAKAASDSRWRIPMYRAPQAPPPPPPPMAHAPPGYGPPPRFPYPGRLLSSAHLYGALGNNRDGSLPQHFHRWIQCDGCGMQPIVGPRYKSNVKEDYDLCDACFCRMGNEVEYTRIDKPILPHRPNLCRKIHSRSAIKLKREKLESRFILDVTVLDGTLMAPSTPFIKIWRMHNNGSIMWPSGAQLIWVGGDQFALQTSVPLEIPANGFPVDEEIDIAVDFVAPARPGRYISYWRLASPTGQKFGQRVWVHIQVEDPSFVNDNKPATINLNLPPINLNLPLDSSSTNSSNLIDVNVEPVDQVFGEHVKSTKLELLEPLISCEDAELRKPEPAPSLVPSVSAAVPPHPIIDDPSSSASSAAFVPIVDVAAPEPVKTHVPPPVNVPTSLLTTAPVNVPAPAPSSAPINVPSSGPLAIDNFTEEKLLKELEEMGFKQVDLNKEILRQNRYDLEQSVDDLCGVNEWDPLLAELHEMGFDDTEMNREALTKNGGSIKRAVMDLIAREKKDN